MHFAEWSSDTIMANNRFGIPEPAGAAPIRITELQAVLCPLVAFDERGGRLGMGAGYYDRLFATPAKSTLPLRVGVAYEVQRMAHIPMHANDVPLQAMVTEKGWFTCPP